MNYDVVIIGAGLSGFSAALAASNAGCSVALVSKGAGNLISQSGYIHILGYYPASSQEPVKNPIKSVETLIAENPGHPYALTGIDVIKSACHGFLESTREAAIPYTGDLEKNMLMPAVSGALMPSALIPESSATEVQKSHEILVVGIRELMDFYPGYMADNLRRQITNTVSHQWISRKIPMGRALNSYDIALMLESDSEREHFVEQLKPLVIKETLMLFPALLGVNRWKEVTVYFEKSLQCPVLEVTTLPPSVPGIRLWEALRKHLLGKGVDFIQGVTAKAGLVSGKRCREIALISSGGKVRRIGGKSIVLATGGISGGGLEVYPAHMEESVFNLPVEIPEKEAERNFFSREGQPLSYAGVRVNNNLQPLKNSDIILENVFVAGSTLAGYDPYVEKSCTGVALVTGYKAGLNASA